MTYKSRPEESKKVAIKIADGRAFQIEIQLQSLELGVCILFS